MKAYQILLVIAISSCTKAEWNLKKIDDNTQQKLTDSANNKQSVPQEQAVPQESCKVDVIKVTSYGALEYNNVLLNLKSVPFTLIFVKLKYTCDDSDYKLHGIRPTISCNSKFIKTIESREIEANALYGNYDLIIKITLDSIPNGTILELNASIFEDTNAKFKMIVYDTEGLRKSGIDKNVKLN